MSYIDPESHQHIYSAVKAHRRRVLADEQHAASLVRTPFESDEVRIVNEQLANAADSFYEVPSHIAMSRLCICGHDRYSHVDATDDCDHCKDCHGHTDRAAELERFFRDYGDPNQDPQPLQERANTLKPTPEEWGKYRAPVEVDF